MVEDEEIKDTPHKLAGVNTIEEIRKTDTTNINWLIEGFIECNSLNLVFADSNTGKSWWALHAADEISKGGMLYNDSHYKCKQSKVLYLDFENNIDEVSRRHKMLTDTFDNHLHFRFEDIILDNYDKDGKPSSELLTFMRAVKTGEYTVLFIDPIRDAMIGDEDRSNDIAKLSRTLKKLRKDANLTIFALHHTTKGDSSVERGSSAIRGKFDNTFLLREDSHNNIILHQDKRRRGAKQPDVTLRYIFDDISNSFRIQFSGTTLQNDAKEADLEAQISAYLLEHAEVPEDRRYIRMENAIKERNRTSSIYTHSRFDKVLRIMRDSKHLFDEDDLRGNIYTLKT